MISYTNYILDRLELYREYDTANFIANATASLNNKVDLIKADVDMSMYANYLNDVLSDLDNSISVHPDLLLSFFSTFNTNSILIKNTVSDITDPIVSTIRPTYLEQFLTSIGLLIDRTIKGGDPNYRYGIEDIEKLRKQLVKASVPDVYYWSDTDNILDEKSRLPKRVPITSDFIKNKIIPFLRNANNSISEVRKDILATIATINKCSKTISEYNKTIDNLTKRENFDDSIIKNVNYVTYSAYRVLLDATSFLDSMVIYKTYNIIGNLTSCISTYNLFTKNQKATELIESASLVPDDTNNLAENLIQGHVDAFVDIANNIFDYNSGIMMNSPESPISFDVNSDNVTSQLLDNATYDKTVYDEIIKMWIIIKEGLSSISAATDDYLLVFDDAIEKSGFDLKLVDRFHSLVNTIDDVSAYTSATNLPVGDFNTVYFNMLAEVRDYGKNMQAIANGCFEVKSVLDHLRDRFENNVNTEYSNTETVKDLIVFLDDIVEDLHDLTKQIVGKFMLRLKNINIALTQMNNKRVENYNYEESFADTNFCKDLDDIFIKSYEKETDLIFESMMREYIKAREMRDRGAIIVFEDGDEETAKKSLLDTISEWFNKLVEKLTDIMNDPQVKRDQEYLRNNRENLLNKDYNGVTSSTSLIDYEAAMPSATISSDINGLKNRTNKETFMKLANLGKEETAKLFFPSSPPVSVFMEDNIADAITQYYKVGNNKNLQPTTFSNNALKTAVDHAVAYCDNYYTNFLPAIKNTITNIKDGMASSTESVVKSTVIKESALFTEEETAKTKTTTVVQSDAAKKVEAKTTSSVNSNTSSNVNNDNNQNTNQNNGSKKVTIVYNFKLANKFITSYSNGLLTSIFDRYKDYMSLCRSIIPDNNNSNNNTNG